MWRFEEAESNDLRLQFYGNLEACINHGILLNLNTAKLWRQEIYLWWACYQDKMILISIQAKFNSFGDSGTDWYSRDQGTAHSVLDRLTVTSVRCRENSLSGEESWQQLSKVLMLPWLSKQPQSHQFKGEVAPQCNLFRAEWIKWHCKNQWWQLVQDTPSF